MEGERAYGGISERYLQALKQTNLTTGLALVLGAGAAALFAATLVVLFGTRWVFGTIVWLLIGAAAAASVLSVVAFIAASADRRHLVAIIDTLRVDWKLHEGVRLAEGIADDELRTRILVALSLHLSGMVPTPGAMRELSRSERVPAALPPRSDPYYGWRRHFRHRGRRIVLERDAVGRWR